MPNIQYILPAEWHPQYCVHMTWPHKNTDWVPYLDEITETMTAIAEAITQYEKLIIASQFPDETEAALRKKLSSQQLENVEIIHCTTDDTWARDHSGITKVVLLHDKSGAFTDQKQCFHRPKAALLDFRFNGWGEKFPADNDNRITKRLFEAGAISGELIDYNDFVLEGGSIESDGKGTIFTTSQCLMAPNRNQPLSQSEVEEELLRRLDAKRIVWLNHGNLIGDDTDGHIDTIVRVCPDDTLLYIKSTDPGDEQHQDFEALEQELMALRTENGEPYRLMPLPMPRPCWYDGERLPATYANFLIINGAVIVPTYGQEDLDKEACETIGKAFPDREIIPIDSTIIIRQHGSIHCLTMQYPREVSE